MSSESPQQFYLRAREDFIKSPGLNEAANLYFAVQNLNNHGITYHVAPSTIHAFSILKNEDAIDGSEGPEPVDFGGPNYETPQMKRDRRQLAREKSQLVARKAGTKYRRIDTPGKHPPLMPAFDAVNLPLSDFWRYQNRNLRDLWEHLATDPQVKGIPNEMVDAFYHYRPSGEHPLASIFDEGLNGNPKWHTLMDRLYTSTSPDNAATLDSKMRRHDEKFGAMVESGAFSKDRSYEEMYGKFDDNSVGLHDMFLHGLNRWRVLHGQKYGKEGDIDSYLAYLKMSMEGVPLDVINDTLFTDEGNLRSDHSRRSKTAIKNAGDPSQQMGLLPLLLGLENLSMKDGKTAVKWFMDGAQGSFKDDPESAKSTSFLDGQKDPESLLSRVWKKRLGAITSAMTSPLIQAGIQQPPTRAKDLDPKRDTGGTRKNDMKGESMTRSARDSDLWHRALMWCRADKDGVHRMDRGKGPSVFNQLMNRFGILPNGSGHYGTSHPEINEKLVDDWLRNKVGGVTKEQIAKLKEWREKVEKYANKDWTKTAWAAPFSGPLTEEGKPSFAKVYHDVFASESGGHSMSPADMMQAFHDMFGGLFTMPPHYEQSQLQGENKKTVRQVIFDEDGEDKRRGGSDDWEAATRLIGETGLVPLAGEGEMGDERVGMDYSPWFGMFMPKDRDIISNMEGTGSQLFQNSSLTNFAALPRLPFSLRDYHNQKRSLGLRAGIRFGDNHQHSDRKIRSADAAQLSYNLGSTYPHKEEHDLGEANRMTHLLDLVMGMFHEHGNSHSLYDMFQYGPEVFLSELLARRGDPLTPDISSPHGSPNLVTIGRLLEGADLMRYITDSETGTEKIADSPYDVMGDRHAIYYHHDDGNYAMGEKGMLHGLEPNNGRSDAIPLRLDEFTASPETVPIERLLIHPHMRMRANALGRVAELRSILRDDVTLPESRNPGFHQKRLLDTIRAVGRREGWGPERLQKEIDIVLGKQAPDDPSVFDRYGGWAIADGMEDHDKYPILDATSDALWEGGMGRPSHAEGPLSMDDTGWSDMNEYNYSKNFPHYLLTSGAYRKYRKAPTQKSQVEVGDGPQRSFMDMLSETEFADPEEDDGESGYLLAPEPFALMSNHIERLRDFALTFDEDSVARRRVEEAIRQQQMMQFDLAYSDGSAFDASDAQIGRMGHAHMLLRMVADTLHHTGIVAQALKKHHIAQDQNNAALYDVPNDDSIAAEAYANHMELLHFANSLLHHPDQSWREALAKEMDKMGETSLSQQLREPRSQSTYISPQIRGGSYNPETGQYEVADADSEAYERLLGPFADKQWVKGTDLARHYIENGHHGSFDDEGNVESDVVARALRALRTLDKYNDTDHVVEKIEDLFGEGSKYFRDDDEKLTGFTLTPKNRTRDDFNALLHVLGDMRRDSANTTRVRSVSDNGFLADWAPSTSYSSSTGLSKNARRSRNLNITRELSRLLHNYAWDHEGGQGRLTMTESDLPKTVPFGGMEGLAPLSLFSSATLKNKASTPTRASIVPTYNGGLPQMTSAVGMPAHDRPRVHVAHNVLSGIMGEDLSAFAGRTMGPEAGDWYDAEGARTQAQRAMQTMPPNETLGDGSIMASLDLDLDVLTDEDLLHKKDEGDPVPIKPMHRIFSLDDLEHLRGFSGDWVVTSWPEGERVIVHKKDKKLVITNGGGKKVTIPNQVRKDVRKAHDSDFIVDAIWDEECLHIIDIIKIADEKVSDEQTKDRNRLLRAKFEATDNVSIPAPINTKRTDNDGLQRAYDDLMKEKGVKQVLLRDAGATYMRGEARHPKWVLWRPDRTIDVRVVSSSGAQHCLGVGPIDEETAKKIGNRSQEYDGEHYMDVGSLYNTKVEEGDYITIAVSSTSVSTRSKEQVYQVNAPRYLGPSESHATDSIETLRILSPVTEQNIPHKVRVNKGNVLLSFPLGDVTYETEPLGHAFIIKAVDAPSDYLGRIAETQRPYWGPLAAVLLRSDKEKMKVVEEDSDAVEPEPPANHDKKPKKVLKPSERLLKDPELTKSIVVSLHRVEELLKEKITWTGPKGLGIDHGSPIESPSGPTENTEGYNLPDHDPGHRAEKHGACWCGAEKGQSCEQGRAHKMEDCPIAHPPRDESKDPKHLQFSHSSRSDSSV